MRPAFSARPCMVASVVPASSTALRAICAELTTWRPISAIEEELLGARRYGLNVDCGLFGRRCYRIDQLAGLVGGRRHALRRALHGISGSLQAVQRGANGAFEADNPALHTRCALGFGGAILVLIGAEPAGLDHAVAEDLERVRHFRDFVVLT